MERLVARREGLLVEELDGGIVIYDERCDQAHWLDMSTAAVWRACQEPRGEAEISVAAGVDATVCQVALSHLAQLGLLETESGNAYSRRTVLRTAAKIGVGGAVAAPIVSAMIPVAAAHASTRGGGGGGGGGTTTTFTVQSGNERNPDGSPGPGAPGSPDPLNAGLFTGAQQPPPFPPGPPAFNIVPNGSYAAAIGTSNWISTDPNGGNNDDPPGFYYYTYLPGLTIPAGASGATITGAFMSDNPGQVFVNNVQVGDDSGVEFSAPTPFGPVPLNPGNNILQFQVLNEGGPTALDYFATVSYTM